MMRSKVLLRRPGCFVRENINCLLSKQPAEFAFNEATSTHTDIVGRRGSFSTSSTNASDSGNQIQTVSVDDKEGSVAIGIWVTDSYQLSNTV
ncbi:hypothetical protein AB6A40_003738 [Gnathostoma spinigerum]|uniref:Uncharacterized protein n=1 Tax=Gnathostoma spinigerum TaxID=75299 RepID=A0ABD6EI64_9BILA